MPFNPLSLRPLPRLGDVLRGRRKVLDRRIAGANAVRDAREWQQAANLYKAILDEYGERADLWVQYGHCQKESGSIDAALAAYRKAVELMPHDADAHLQLGHCLKIAGDRDAARESYLRAHVLDPDSPHVRLELLQLGWPPGLMVSGGTPTVTTSPFNRHAILDEALAPVVFDVTDLFHYYLHARVPTGIQRVQICMISALLGEDEPGIAVVCFSGYTDTWLAVPPTLFVRLAEMALAGGPPEETAWLNARVELQVLLRSGSAARFARGATLINLGTSWWLRNYFLMVREAKRRYGIRYVPFVHDLIPVLAPEHCTDGLVRDFVAWIIGVFRHADGFLTNSQSTSRDLSRVAEYLGCLPPQPAVIPLDGRVDLSPHGTTGRLPGVLLRLGVEAPFVLFVSTIESRKNHALAFRVWQDLLASRGTRRTPMLVCVGNPGWLVSAAMARLNSSETLRRKVRILSKVSDADLATLYQSCLFTIYPSSYEGWGLPITESLCHGKIPITTRVSSLPEAGGDWAEYFEISSPTDFQEKVERLVDDRTYRETRERDIRQRFRPRSWSIIAKELVTASLDRGGEPDAEPTYRPEPWPRVLPAGKLMRLASSQRTAVYPGLFDPEVFRGEGSWQAPEAWGVWMKSKAACLAFRLPAEASVDWRLYVGLRGLPDGRALRYEVQVGPATAAVCGILAGGACCWVPVMLPVRTHPDDAVEIVLRSTPDGEPSPSPDADGATYCLGVIGLYLCRADDVAQRLAFVEALQGNCLDTLELRASDEWDDGAGEDTQRL